MPRVNDAGRCPDCGKYRYHSRDDAKRAWRARRWMGRMNAYRCGDYWHIGHLSDAVRRGEADRGVYDRRPA